MLLYITGRFIILDLKLFTLFISKISPSYDRDYQQQAFILTWRRDTVMMHTSSRKKIRSAEKAKSACGSWDSLPMEIRLMILEAISHERTSTDLTYKHHA